MKHAFCQQWENPVQDNFDDTNAETNDDPYPPRRKFFHVTQTKAGITIFGSVIAALTVFSFVADSRLDNRMLSERDWIAVHFVSASQEDERIKALDRRLQEIRETQVQIATMLDEMRKQIFDRSRK